MDEKAKQLYLYHNTILAAAYLKLASADETKAAAEQLEQMTRTTEVAIIFHSVVQTALDMYDERFTTANLFYNDKEGEGNGIDTLKSVSSK